MAEKNPNPNNDQAGNRTRFETIQARTASARNGLLTDIKNWAELKKIDPTVAFHVNQFWQLCQRVLDQIDKEDKQDAEDYVIFKSQVIGSLTAQWLLLREVASQRVKGSPYQTVLQSLDQQAALYYQTIRKALPDGVGNCIPASPPLISLGTSAEFFLFTNQDQSPPAIISIPFGVIFEELDNQSKAAIAHETGHAIFDRIKPFIPELEKTISAKLNLEDGQIPRQDQILYRVILQWLSEIVADLVGMALVGPAFANSGLSMIAGPEAYLGLTDRTHPVPIIRPYIYLDFLQFLDEAKVQLPQYIAGIDPLNKQLELFIDEKHLDRRFEALPARTFITLKQVRDALRAVTGYILNSELDTLKGKKLGDILIECATGVSLPAEAKVATFDANEKWGKSIKIDNPFVLDLSHMVAPAYSVPISMGGWISDAIKCALGNC